ncbi:invasion associated locus B family protein [Rhizobium sp. A22-96]
MCHSGFALVCSIVMFMLAPAAFAQSALPNGASTVQEIYQDWRLTCNMRDKVSTCAVSQDQTQQNGQRLLAAEIQMRADGSAIATLLLPFGIVLDPGVTPNVDDQPALKPVRFRTCLPTGCIALLPVDSATLAKLRAGSRLNLKVIGDPDKALSFQVSLRGLSAALDRVGVLSPR